MSLLRRTLRFPAQPSTTFRTSQRLPLTARPFSQSTLRSFPRKDSQDKDSINTEATEYSKSGTDDQSASATENTAFDPKTTSPEAEHRQANREVGGDEVSFLLASFGFWCGWLRERWVERYGLGSAVFACCFMCVIVADSVMLG